MGHSQGEIAAACVAGALSLEDAARVVAVRSQVIAGSLAGRGGMASVALSEAEVAGRIERWDGRVEVAAVNGPSSVVIAGDAEALDEALDVLAVEGVRVRRVAVDYASHTRHVEAIEEILGEAFADIRAQAPLIPFYSTVTGEWVKEAGVLDGGYWYRNLRGQVRFGPAIADLLGEGYSVFVESSAHPVLVQPVSEIVDQADTEAVVGGSLRREEGGLGRLLTSMAELFVQGVVVDWAGVLPASAAATQVELPTYAFDHQHYWLRSAPAVDAVALGQAGVDHPLLGAVVAVPETGGVLCTSRLSLRTHPWLADHAVSGVVLVPGTGLVELAVRAGDEVGCGVVEELVIEAPLVVPETGGVRVQVAVGGLEESGARAVTVYSASEDSVGDHDGEVWTRHATGRLGPALAGSTDMAGFDVSVWPPAGAERVPLDVAGFYEEMRVRGYAFGPSFRGLRAVWRRGEEVFAEVVLPDEQRENAVRFGIHPALFDAALHARGLVRPDEAAAGAGGSRTVLPFSWNDVALYAAGASALRVRLVSSGPDVLSLQAADETGEPVLAMDSLVFREVSAERLGAAGGDGSLFRVEWAELPASGLGSEMVSSWVPVATAEDVAALAVDAPAVAVLEAFGDGAEDADEVLALTGRALGVLQAWLVAPAFESGKLVVVTRGAVPAGGDADVTDPAGAAVWGLVRAAQAENPDRIILLDLDPAGSAGAGPVLGRVLAAVEPLVAVRGTVLSAPRLVRAAAVETEGGYAFASGGTVLVTGGTGSLGVLVARHLVAEHGVRHLLLVSRRGPEAEGAAELVAELGESGAVVTVCACDVADRDAVAALVAAVPAEHPLTGVVHLAGVLDDGVIGALTPERIEGVFAPKVTAVRHLDELTRELVPQLASFIVFSSAAALLGSAGQGSYAAANSYLDALMAHRRAAGLPGVSMAWGLWQQSTGLTAHLSEIDQARMSRGGILPLTPAEGMGLFDAALRVPAALVVPMKVDLRRLRADAVAGGGLPELLGGLVQSGRRRARAGDGQAGAGDGGSGLAARLAGLTSQEQEALLLDFVRGHVATVLGHAGIAKVGAEMAFKDSGFDSLTSVELRNRLRGATGLKLPATIVFDYPNPLALARYLHREVFPDGVTAGPDVDEARLRRGLASLPLARFRAAGLLDALVRLVELNDHETPIGMVDDADDETAIADLNVDDLVQLALGDDK
ncbi:SDR family NAD(P)-dependent oxidoreductase [Streptomyces sp. SBT349]|uniref:type I polyketide synthase n=1 Tax=Streptomyces sp. SBT349 TaxID=1580539 RepID=UPI001F2C3E43|nr:SDR family NAD(P)-dependent oxidoreductase [Streptomyces sp. SBT349]